MTTLVIIAKEPLPGKAKTRLHPAVSLVQAAELAAAAIQDTLTAMAAVPATRRILFFQGSVRPEGSDDYELVAQSEGGLDDRLATIFDSLDEPTLLIGMDTPQASLTELAPAFTGDWIPDAWFGPACDGGFWALGMSEPRGDLIRGIPMSQPDTGHRQLARLTNAGLTVGMLPPLTDVDTIDTAFEVARLIPNSRFAHTLMAVAA